MSIFNAARVSATGYRLIGRPVWRASFIRKKMAPELTSASLESLDSFTQDFMSTAMGVQHEVAH